MRVEERRCYPKIKSSEIFRRLKNIVEWSIHESVCLSKRPTARFRMAQYHTTHTILPLCGLWFNKFTKMCRIHHFMEYSISNATHSIFLIHSVWRIISNINLDFFLNLFTHDLIPKLLSTVFNFFFLIINLKIIFVQKHVASWQPDPIMS